MISIRQTKRIKKLYPSKAPLFIDSGGFSELSLYGRWKTTVSEYLLEIKRISEYCGNIEHIAPMDYMCEPMMTHITGLTVYEHQKRTVENYIELREKTSLPIIPVLQGYSLEQYIECYHMYRQNDVTLDGLIGLGSVCRRQATDDIKAIVEYFYGEGLKLHGFGVKQKGLEKYSGKLSSVDSMAWSIKGRYDTPLPGHTHINCANCLEYALNWYNETVNKNTRVPL